MKAIYDFIKAHAQRGSCQCGKCIDAPEAPIEPSASHTADMVFFRVACKGEASADALKQLIQENKRGEFGEVDLFDGKEHNYLELGGWIGDQGAALTLMGIGSLLGLWQLFTPVTMLRIKSSDPLAQQLAGMGMISICAKV